MSSIRSVLIRSHAITHQRRLIPTIKSYIDDPTKVLRSDLILLGSSAWLQHNDPPQIPTTTMVLVITLILFLFLVCPYLIGKVLAKPEWRENEEMMEAELPQWDATDNWAELFPSYLAGDVDSSKRSKAASEK